MKKTRNRQIEVREEELAVWCLEQVDARFFGALSPRKIEKLDAIGFPWDLYAERLDSLGYDWEKNSKNSLRKSPFQEELLKKYVTRRDA